MNSAPAMEASGRPRKAGAMLSEYRKLVYADDRYNDNILSFANLKSILLLEDFFLKSFDRLCVFLFSFLSLFLFGLVFFFCKIFLRVTHYEMQKKKKKKKKKKKTTKKKQQNLKNNNLQNGRTNTLLYRSF